jgi:DNA-binding response OmpR family regulator
MKKKSFILVVEHDLMVRQPLAEYLRECGYWVVEATHTDEAIEVLQTASIAVEIVLADVSSSAKIDGFGLSRWMKANGLAAKLILAGTAEKVAATAGDLCEHGPLLTKPYDHALLLDRIKRESAARDRTRTPGPKG